MKPPPWTEPILHVDMDAFFVEVERLRRPELVGLPVVVGADSARGVVAAASYEARQFGIASAMPMARARKACGALVIVAPDHGEYRRVSAHIFEIFRSTTPLVEGLSVDEAFLDTSGLRHHYPGPGDIAREIRGRIRQEVGLPASVGIAATKFVAKLASEAAKPDGVRHIRLVDQPEFLRALDVRSLWGVGEATYATLEGLGVETVGDLGVVPTAVLERRLGAGLAHHLLALAAGIDPRAVEPDSDAVSISVEETYDIDLIGSSSLAAALLAHADRLGARLKTAGMVARTISIKLKYADFTTVTRSRTLESPTDVGRHLHRVAVGLLDKVDVDRPIRLVGIVATGLGEVGGPRQLTVDDSGRWDSVSDAVASVRERFGAGSVGPAGVMASPRRSPGRDDDSGKV